MVEGLSPIFTSNDEPILKQWREFQKEIAIGQVTTDQIREHLSWLRTEYQPRCVTGSSPQADRKHLHHTQNFLTLGERRVHPSKPDDRVARFKSSEPEIEPIIREEGETLLKTGDYSREFRPSNRRSFTMRLRFSHRDQAIILTLIDTGLRAIELCKLELTRFSGQG